MAVFFNAIFSLKLIIFLNTIFTYMRCATSRTVAGSIPVGVTGFFSEIFLPTLP